MASKSGAQTAQAINVEELSILDTTWSRVESLPPRRNGKQRAAKSSQAVASNGNGDEIADDDEWEEDEVSYLTLDFGGKLAVEDLLQQRGQTQGLESSTPFVRVGPHVFKGQHETLIGGEILLKHDPSTLAFEPLPTPSTYKIFFKPVKLTPRNPDDPPTDPDDDPKQKKQVVKPVKRKGRPRGSKNKVRPGDRGSSSGTGTGDDGEDIPGLPELSGDEGGASESRSSRGRGGGRGRPRGRGRGKGRARGRSASDTPSGNAGSDVEMVDDGRSSGEGDTGSEANVAPSSVKATTNGKGAQKSDVTATNDVDNEDDDDDDDDDDDLYR